MKYLLSAVAGFAIGAASMATFGSHFQLERKADVEYQTKETNTVTDMVVNSFRTANIVANIHRWEQSVDLQPEQKSYVELAYQFINSSQEKHKYYNEMMMRGVNLAYKPTDSGYIFDSQWHIELNEGSPYKNQMPTMLKLALHDETIAYPVCKDAEKPVIMYVEAFRPPALLKKGVNLVGGELGWTLKLNDFNYSTDGIYHAILFETGCREITKES